MCTGLSEHLNICNNQNTQTRIRSSLFAEWSQSEACEGSAEHEGKVINVED